MSRTTTLQASCKLCRREGEKLFLKGDRCYTSKCAIVRRNFMPGQHGVKRQPRLSEYGTQLRNKQKAKRLYGVMERQFVNYYKKAVNHEDSANGLKQLLERRFDNVVYRIGLAGSRSQARQMVTHAHLLVNGKKMDIPSYQVSVGDEITIREKSTGKAIFKGLTEKLAQSELPSWLTLDLSEMKGKIVSMPTPEDLKDTIEANQIIEFYSRF
jgi:small subunit ribosomal protein S4